MYGGAEQEQHASRRRAIAVLGMAIVMVVATFGFGFGGAAVAADNDDAPDDIDYVVEADSYEVDTEDNVSIPFTADAEEGDEDSEISTMELVVEYDEEHLEFTEAEVPFAEEEDVTVEHEDGEVVVEWEPSVIDDPEFDITDPEGTIIDFFGGDGPTMDDEDIVFLDFEVDGEDGEEAVVDMTDDTTITSGWTELSEYDDDEIHYGEAELEIVDQGAPVASFDAVSQGGFVAFDEDGSEEEAREEGEDFPAADEDDDDPFQIEGDIFDDGTWESTATIFPPFETDSGVQADVEARLGLEGVVDQEDGFMTTAGELTVIIDDNPDYQFSFDINATTEESGELTGDADIEENEGGSLTVVDNEFIVDDETGNTAIDGSLGLPAEEEGTNWLEMKLDIDVQEELDDAGTIEGEVTDDDGEPIDGADVGVDEEDGPSTFTDENGTYELDNVPTGTHDLVASASDYESATAEDVEVEQDAVTEQDFTLAAEEGDAPGDGNESDDVADGEFLAESYGGFVSFDEDNIDDAVEEGLDFEEDAESPIQIRGELQDDGSWESLETVFPTLHVDGDLTAEIEATDGLEGTFDRETGEMTATGELRVLIDGNEDESFTMELDMTSGESGALEGDASVDGDEADVTLVDNEYTVEDTTGDTFIDDTLGLPLEEEGLGWFEMQLEIELDDEFEGDVDDEGDEDEDDTETGAASSILTGLGQALGLLGILSAGGLVALNLLGRFAP